MTTKDDLALYLFEQCQNRTAPLASIVQAVADKAGVSPDSIDDLVRRYKQTGVGLEDTASKILGNNVSEEIVVPVTANIVSPAQAIVPATNYTIHNGQVVTLDQVAPDFNIVDNTIAELKGIPVSNAYFESRSKELFGDVIYDLKNLAKKINGEGRVFDLSLVELLPKGEGFHHRQSFLYKGVKHSGYEMKTDAEIEQDKAKREREIEQSRIERENRLAEKDQLMESLGFDKFDEPDKCFELYNALKESNGDDFVFDINLLTEEGCGNIYYYDEEEYKIVEDCELSDEYYESEAEYISQNPHDYVYDACTTEMIERLYSYDAEVYESDNGNIHVIKE